MAPHADTPPVVTYDDSETLSDLPALRRTHLTDGYRAGLAEGKEQPEIAQKGFDEGYPAGAELGLRVGWVLGVMAELERVEKLEKEILERARGELQVTLLLAEMREKEWVGSGVVEDDEGAEIDELWDLPEGWWAEIKALSTWMAFVEKRGRDLGVDLTFKT